MTPDEVAAIAKRVGFPIQHPEWRKAVEEFAALVEEKATALEREAFAKIQFESILQAIKIEREACAKVVEDSPSYDWHKFACETAFAIRARGQA
jgi:hypothetical protein